MHLLLAHKVKTNGSILFFIGNLAPDAVIDREEKDITHFRNAVDRSAALIELANNTSPTDDFSEGVLLHLYMDWQWDSYVENSFDMTVNWFSEYRNELGFAGSYAYHHTDWAKELWDQMERCNTSDYGYIPGATAVGLGEFISRNKKWHNDNETEASTALPPQLIDEFVEHTAEEYTKWRIRLK